MKKFFNNAYKLMAEHRNGIERKDMYFCKTAGVPQPEYDALLLGFTKIIEETGRNVRIVNYGTYNTGNGDYSSPDWYQKKALTSVDRGLGRQVSAMKLDRLLREEPFQEQKPHFDVMIIDKDMRIQENDPQNNFIFGYGPYPNNIISVKRFIKWISNDQLRYKSLAVLGAHEFGHNLNLSNRNFNVGMEGYKYGHCNGENGPCLMEQVNVSNARSIDEQAKLLFDRNRWLCPDCLEEIEFKKQDLRRQGILW